METNCNHESNMKFHNFVEINWGDNCEFYGFVKINHGNNCVFYDDVGLNNGIHCIFNADLFINHGNFNFFHRTVNYNTGNDCKFINHNEHSNLASITSLSTIEKGLKDFSESHNLLDTNKEKNSVKKSLLSLFNNSCSDQKEQIIQEITNPIDSSIQLKNLPKPIEIKIRFPHEDNDYICISDESIDISESDEEEIIVSQNEDSCSWTNSLSEENEEQDYHDEISIWGENDSSNDGEENIFKIEIQKKPKSPIPSELPKLETANSILEQCVICNTHKKTLAFNKCGHVVFCSECAQQFIENIKSSKKLQLKCPLCRKMSTRMKVIYF